MAQAQVVERIGAAPRFGQQMFDGRRMVVAAREVEAHFAAAPPAAVAVALAKLAEPLLLPVPLDIEGLRYLAMFFRPMSKQYRTNISEAFPDREC